MAPRSSGSNDSEPFKALCEDLSKVLSKKGVIKLPKNTQDRMSQLVKDNRENEDIFFEDVIDELVSVLEGDSTTGRESIPKGSARAQGSQSQEDIAQNIKSCARLDATTWVVVLQTLLLAQRGRSAERGVYLLAASMYHQNVMPKNPGSIKALFNKKKAIGKEIFQQLLECFMTTDDEDHMRVWVGLILISLLENCEANADQMTLGPDDTRRRLGVVVINEDDEIIRIVGGKLLKAARNADLDIQRFWPDTEDPAVHSNFPSSQPNLAWNEDFQAWVDSFGRDENYEGAFHFAQAVRTTPGFLEASGKGIDISIFISKDGVDYELSIYVQAQGVLFDQRLDVPLDLISAIELEPTPADSSNDSSHDPRVKKFDLVIWLSKPASENACFINAKPCTVEHIRITAKDQATAKDILVDIEKRHIGIAKSDEPPKPRTTSHPSQESIQSGWSRISQSAEALCFDDGDSEESEDDRSESGPEDAAHPPGSGDVGNQATKKIQTDMNNPIYVPGTTLAETGLPNDELIWNPMPENNPSSPNPAGQALAVADSPNVAEDKALNYKNGSNVQKLDSTGDRRQKEPLNSRKAKAAISSNSKAQKARPSNVQKEQPAGQNAEAIDPISSQEAGSQARRGRPKKQPTKEVELLIDDGPRKKATTKPKPVLNPGLNLEPQKTVQTHASSRRADKVWEQPRIQTIDKGKGKEKLVDNSGISTDKSRSRTIQSPDLEPRSPSFTSPDSHDVSTPPRVVRNAALREKNGFLANNKGAATAIPDNPPSAVQGKSAKPESTQPKKYSLKAKAPITTAKNPAKSADKKTQMPAAGRSADANLLNQSDDEGGVTKAKASQKSSKLTSKLEKKSTTAEAEKNDSVWDMPLDAEDVPKKPQRKGKATSKTSKPDSKESATWRKNTAKKANVKSTKQPAAIKNKIPKESQPAPAGEDEPKAPTRNRRQAAVTAASKILQQSSDNDSESGDLEDPEPPRKIPVKDSSKSTAKPEVPTAVEKPAQVSRLASTKGVEKAVGLTAKSGNRTRSSTARNKQAPEEVLESPKETIADAPDAVFQQLEEDPIQLNPSQQQLDAVEHNLDAASPALLTRKKSPNKGHRSMAAALKGVIEEIALDKGAYDARSTSMRDLTRQKNVLSDARPISNSISPETNRTLRERKSMSPLEFSSSAKLHSAFKSPKPYEDDQRVHGAPELIIAPVSAPRVEENQSVFETQSSPAVRRQLGLQSVDPPAASHIPNSPKKRTQKGIPKATKKSTPPQRRTPMQHDGATEASIALNQVIIQETVLLDDRLARKTPLIAFGKTGPKNQGVSSSKKTSAEGAKSHEKLGEIDTGSALQPPKRKRGDEVGLDDQERGHRKRVRSSHEPTKVQTTKETKAGPQFDLPLKSPNGAKEVVFNEPEHELGYGVGDDYYDPGTPNSPGGQDIAMTGTAEGSDFEAYNPPQPKIDDDLPLLAAQEQSQSQKSAGNASKVDENGSPMGSTNPSDEYKKLLRGFTANRMAMEGEGGSQGTHNAQERFGASSAGVFHIKKPAESPSHFEMLSSNAKAKPMPPNTEQKRYVAHRETGDDKYEDIVSKEVVHSKRQMEDPFAEQQPRRKLSGFTERLQASRTDVVETRLPPPSLAVKPMQRSKSENDKVHSTKDVELVKEAGRISNVPVKITEALPEPTKVTANIQEFKASVQTREPHALNDGPKRKTAFQTEQNQPDVDGQRKRRKISFEEPNLDTTTKEMQRRPQQPSPERLRLVNQSMQDKLKDRPRKSLSHRENAQPDAVLPETKKKHLLNIENRRTERLAPERPENTIVVTEKSYQRRIQERPAHYPTRRSRTEFEDPERTLVEEQSSPASSSATGSSARTNLTAGSSAASPEPTELSPEEEWGGQLRRHERPILKSLYRIVNELVSHLVGQREAIDDIVEDYTAGGTDLIKMLEGDHNAEKDRVLADFEVAKTRLSSSYAAAQRTIAQGSKGAKASSISSLEREWREQEDDLQSFISESIDGE